MSPLIRKEIKLIVPAWVAAMVLATFPVWVFWPGNHGLILNSPGMLVYAPFGIGVLLLGLSPLGQEINWGTFSILLAQPVARRQLWRAKTRVLALALGLVWVTFFVSTHFRVETVIEELKATDWHKLWNSPVTEAQMQGVVEGTRWQVFGDSLLLGGSFVLAACAGGLWTNLLFRNTSASFWFSLLIPLGLGLLTDKLFVGPLGELGLFVALGIYSVGGILWARNYFLRVEDFPWTGGLLWLPSLRRASTGSADPAFQRQPGPFRALVRKEFQLHQVNLLIAGVLLVIHLGVILVRRLAMDYFTKHQSVAMIWESWPLVWLAMPLLIGGVAVAEERKLGMLETDLCLPATRRQQFWVKLLVTLLLGGVLGSLMPLLIEWIGTWVGLSNRTFAPVMHLDLDLGFVNLASALWFGALALTAVAFFASTLTRNLLQAIGLGVVLSLFWGGVVLITAAIAHSRIGWGESNPLLWRGILFDLLGWPAILATLTVLAYKNFQKVNLGAKCWWRTLRSVLVALLVMTVLVSALYHRFWEIWMPVEPSHSMNFDDRWIHVGRQGIVNFETPSVGSKMAVSSARVAAVLPNGKLWLRARAGQIQQPDRYPVTHLTGPLHDGFVDGGDWREVAVTPTSTFAIRSDGTLWDLSELPREKNLRFLQPRPVGQDHDWKQVSGSASFNHFTGLKYDGSLWEWGTTLAGSNQVLVPIEMDHPVRVGGDTDWITIGDACWCSMPAVKTDGSIWRWGRVLPGPAFTRSPQRWLYCPGSKPAFISYQDDVLAAVCEDGSLWVGGDRLPGFLRDRWATAGHTMVRVGEDLQWQEAKWIDHTKLVAISFHELWSWGPPSWRSRFPWRSAPTAAVQQSGFSIWLSVGANDGQYYALAADGKLCLWGDPQKAKSYESTDFDQGESVNYLDSSNYLMPTRIKARTVADLRE